MTPPPFSLPQWLCQLHPPCQPLFISNSQPFPNTYQVILTTCHSCGSWIFLGLWRKSHVSRYNVASQHLRVVIYTNKHPTIIPHVA